MILVNTNIEDKHLTLINIYAPNSQNERKTFLNKLQEWSMKFALNKDEIIIGGDYNKLDRHENSTYTIDTSLKSYLNSKDKLQ